MKQSQTGLAQGFGVLLIAIFCLTDMGMAHAQIFVANTSGSSVGPNDTIGEYNPDGSSVNASLVSDANGVQGLAVSGSVLLVSQGNNTVGEYSTSGAQLNTAFISGVSDPTGLTISGSNVFVASGTGGTIGEYDATTGAPINASFISGLSSPISPRISGGYLFVVNSSTGTIGEYNATTGATVNASLVSGLSNPVGLAVSGSDLFVANETGGTIGEYTTSGATVNASLVSGLSSPTGLVLAGSNLYVSNSSSGTIGEYSNTGGIVNAALVTGFNSVGALASLTPASSIPVAPATSQTRLSAGTAYNPTTVTPLTSSGGLGTTVSLVGGLANSNQTVTLSVSNAGSDFTSLASDTVGVTGNNGNVFALKLSFDLHAADQVGGAGNMTLLWLNPSTDLWENAVDGNTGTNTTNSNYLDYNGSFANFESTYGVTDANLGNFLGAYGVNTANDTVWAVIDHNSTFGVGNPSDLPQPSSTPEPSSWTLQFCAIALLAFLRQHKHRNRS